MGKIEKKGEKYIYRQNDGEVTAWFDHIDEKKVLVHEGRPIYRWVFKLSVTVGVLYLLLIFSMV